MGWGIGSVQRKNFTTGGAYADTVDGLPGGEPLAHWQFDNASGNLTDRKAGARDAVPSGTLVYSQLTLPVDDGTSVDFAGTGSASISHDAGLALATFSLSFWFRINALPSTEIGSGQEAIIGKDAVGFNAGDFTIYVTALGELVANFQTTVNHQVVGTVISDRTYHAVVRADSTGFDMYLDGKYLGKNTGYTGAWSVNTNALQFGATAFISDLFNGRIDEVALYTRMLTEAEVITLSQRTEAPIANNDSFNVPEEQTTIVDPLVNDLYVGQQSNLDVTITQQPALGTASVEIDKRVALAMGAVSENTPDSFRYRITDSIGQSNEAIANLTVQDAAAPSAGDDGQGGILVYHWEALGSWIDGVPLDDRNSNDIAVDGINHWWQDGANPANGGARIGHDLPNLFANWSGPQQVCFNRAPDGTPALEAQGRPGSNGVFLLALELFANNINPRHLRIVTEWKHCVPGDPTTHKLNGLDPNSNPYPEMTDSFLGDHSGKYFGGTFMGSAASGACQTNWYNNASFTRGRGYLASSFSSGGGHKTYAYIYDRSTQCGIQQDANPQFLLQSTAMNGKWNRFECEVRLTDPARNNGTWGGTSQPSNGDGFARYFMTTDVDGSPSARFQWANISNRVFNTSDNNFHINVALRGPWLYQYHGGSPTPLIEYWVWMRKIQVYHYPEDDI